MIDLIKLKEVLALICSEAILNNSLRNLQVLFKWVFDKYSESSFAKKIEIEQAESQAVASLV